MKKRQTGSTGLPFFDYCIAIYALSAKRMPLYLLSAVCRINPRTPQEMISPMPTVSIINGIGSGVI